MDDPAFYPSSMDDDDPSGSPGELSGQAAGEPSALEVFLVCAHQMLDPFTPESVRVRLEPRLLAQLPVLRALGVFTLFEVRDPALRRLLEDEWGSSLAD